MKFFRLLPLLLALVLMLSGCGEAEAVSSDPAGGVYTPDPLAVDVDVYYSDFPEGIQPAVCVDGRVYYWGGASLRLYGTETPEAEVYSIGNGDPYLPDGYTSAGAISSVTTDVPTEELQLRGGFDVTGEVYTSPDTPETVYVWMVTDWNDGFYGRFISTALARDIIRYNGQNYMIRIGYEGCEALEELPSGCQEIGQLHYIGRDKLPENDLETNCASDAFSKALEGRTVYFDPDHPETVYVYEHHYWAEGDYPTYRVCPVME